MGARFGEEKRPAVHVARRTGGAFAHKGRPPHGVPARTNLTNVTLQPLHTLSFHLLCAEESPRVIHGAWVVQYTVSNRHCLCLQHHKDHASRDVDTGFSVEEKCRNAHRRAPWRRRPFVEAHVVEPRCDLLSVHSCPPPCRAEPAQCARAT